MDPLFATPAEYDPDLFRFWARSAYLLGWVTTSPVPIPLITKGDSKNKHPGAIGQAGTQIQVGNEGLGYRRFSGMGVSAGEWIDAQRSIGVEAGGYAMEQRVVNVVNKSDGTGAPLLALPYFSNTPGATGENAVVISQTSKRFGDILIAPSLQRWGMEMNGLFCFWRQPDLECSLLGGVRYDDLLERLSLTADSALIRGGASFSLNDSFSTRNQFAGGQIGGRIHWRHEALFFDVTGKIALGSTHQVLEIEGESSRSATKTTPAGTFPGGLFAQPSNIGRYVDNSFGFIPTLEVKIGIQVTPRLRAFAGYDILYWQVIRPGEQIDRNVNLTQSAVLGGTQGVLSGPASPTPLFHRPTDFWTQAASFGFELRF